MLAHSTIHPSFFHQNSDLLFIQNTSFFLYQHHNPNLLFNIINTIHPSFFIRILFYYSPNSHLFLFTILIYYSYNTHLFFINSVIILIYYSTKSVLYTHLFYQNSVLLFVQHPSFFHHKPHNPDLLFNIIGSFHPSFLSEF